MNRQVTTAPRTAMLLGVATALAGVGAALLWSRTRKPQHVLTTRRPGNPPVWAQASAIVASSASALLLLVRQKV
jgi:hypothetical protein